MFMQKDKVVLYCGCYHPDHSDRVVCLGRFPHHRASTSRLDVGERVSSDDTLSGDTSNGNHGEASVLVCVRRKRGG